MNNIGGIIIMTGTTFERFSTCGAILRNFRTNFSSFGLKASPSGPEVYYYRANQL